MTCLFLILDFVKKKKKKSPPKESDLYMFFSACSTFFNWCDLYFEATYSPKIQETARKSRL